jgi:hypothetical protein
MTYSVYPVVTRSENSHEIGGYHSLIEGFIPSILKAVYSFETSGINQHTNPEDQIFQKWTASQGTPSRLHSLGMCESHDSVDVSFNKFICTQY